MSEQHDIEMQIFEELKKLKDVVSKVREAENAYRNSVELLQKATNQYSDTSLLKEELNTYVQSSSENLHRIFSIWERANATKIGFLDEELIKLKSNSPKDPSPQIHKISMQVQALSQSISSLAVEFLQLKKQQKNNTLMIRVGLFLIILIGFFIIVFK